MAPGLSILEYATRAVGYGAGPVYSTCPYSHTPIPPIPPYHHIPFPMPVGYGAGPIYCTLYSTLHGFLRLPNYVSVYGRNDYGELPGFGLR